MNIFTLPYTQRIQEWRKLREKYRFKKLKEKELKEIINWINQAPFVDYCLIIEEPSSWPTPWEMIYSCIFDDSSKTLLSAYTIIFTTYDSDSLCLLQLHDRDMKEIIFVAYYQGYLVNYHGDVVELKSLKDRDIWVINCFKYTDNGYWTPVSDFLGHINDVCKKLED